MSGCLSSCTRADVQARRWQAVFTVPTSYLVLGEWLLNSCAGRSTAGRILTADVLSFKFSFACLLAYQKCVKIVHCGAHDGN